MNLAAGKEGIFFPIGSGPLSLKHVPKRTERNQRVGFSLACFKGCSLAQYPGLSKASISLPCLRKTINKNFILKASQFGE